MHLDALEGLPANLPGEADFADFEELVSGKKIHDLSILLLVATKRYGWSDEETASLATSIRGLMDYAEMVKKHNLKRTQDI